MLYRHSSQVLLLGLASCLLCLANAAPALAASYGVSAGVPFSIPTVPAIIRPSFRSLIVHNQSISLDGSCQALKPLSIISIESSGMTIGSAPCTDSFQVHVTLQPGTNQLRARTTNLSGDYGPDSEPIAVTFAPSPPVTPPQSGPTPPPLLDAAVPQNPRITMPQPFVALDPRHATMITLVLDGGTAPYTVVLNWQDNMETFDNVTAGTHQYAHQYPTDGTRTVAVAVTDTHGSRAFFNYAVVGYHQRMPVPVAPSLPLMSRAITGLMLLGSILVTGFVGYIASHLLHTKLVSGRLYREPAGKPVRKHAKKQPRATKI